jgi:hypothetical protein
MTWVLIIWSALILIWAIAGGASNDCASETTQLNQDACEAGTGIGVAIVLFIGFIGFVFFSLIWFMTRPRGRDCPVCGELVRKGRTQCQNCGHDFATEQAAAGRQTQAPQRQQVPAGWFPDPTNEAAERYWDGGRWTEEIRSSTPTATVQTQAPQRQQVPAGWFPDPKNEAEERYWDGERWSEQVRGGLVVTSAQTPPTTSEQIPAGWFPDPKNEAEERYWDGERWSEQVRGLRAIATRRGGHVGPT